MKKIILVFVFFGFFQNLATAQDIHYSQFFNSSLNLNPALTGIYNGHYRLAGNYRNQWENVPVDYQTFTGEFDMKFGNVSDTTGFWSGGIQLNHDKAGDLGFRSTDIGLFASYSLRLSDGNYLTPGIKLGYDLRRFDSDNIRSGNQWNGDSWDPSIAAEGFSKDNVSYFDLGLGLNYRWQKSYRTHVDLGGGLFNILSPDNSFAESNYTSDLERRLSLYLLASFRLVDRLDLLLNGTFQQQNPHEQLNVNAQGKIYLNGNSDRDVALILGVGTRLKDAWYPMVALQMKSLYVGFSYDFNISRFDIATDNRGGPELAVKYIITRVPWAPFKPCPIY